MLYAVEKLEAALKISFSNLVDQIKIYGQMDKCTDGVKTVKQLAW